MFFKRRISSDSHEPSGNQILSQPAHALPTQDVVRELASDGRLGLQHTEATARLLKYGPNLFGEEKAIQPIRILFAQLFNVMTLILVLAMAASFAIKSWVEGGVLAALILIDLVIGFFQDMQAARIVASLKSLQSSTAIVWRDGSYQAIDAKTLVPGDFIELKTGDIVPADARLVDATSLETDEALLTGESLPVRKDPDVMLDRQDVSPGDRLNVLFSSTIITKGRGHAIIFATGSFTEIGKIAAALKDQGTSEEAKKKPQRDIHKPLTYFAPLKFAILNLCRHIGSFLGLTVGTPLQRKLSRLFLYVFALAILFAIIVLAANKFDGRSDVIIYAIATAIGTLPATLVLVLTITMAAGSRVMMQRNVAVRNMQSLEALGGVTDICSDKTGTLTQGKMVGKEAWLASYGTLLIESFDEPYNPDVGIIKYVAENSHQSETSKCESSEKIPNHPALNHFLQIAALANHATLTKVDSKESTGELFWKAKGDPTEIAILVFASRFGLEDNLPLPKLEWSEIQEFPFESAIKIMSVICRRGDTHESRLFTKGAVEKVMRRCSLISGLQSEDPRPLNDEDSLNILANMKRLAQKGLRVLAVADKPVQFTMGEDLKQPKFSRDKMECELTFRGLIGIYDPPRPESKPSVLKCHQAGIQVHMLTGDHIDTARTIATEVGILPRRIELLRADIAKAAVMTAQEFDKLSEEEMNSLPELPLVVARCTPSTKVHMIKTLHRRGKFVAMTGDGVNDAPSLRHADIGIAMGVNGSEVAKSVSDIILQDDNFASILNAVEEGRRIFDNVQKFMIHVLAANVGLVITLLVGLAFRDPDDKSLYPLSPVEILFMLLVAGAFTENGLGFEAASPDILRRPPQNLKYGLLTPAFWADLVVYGLIMAACLLGSFSIVLFGFYGGQIGNDCNIKYSDSCDAAFRARSTCYTVMMWIFLLFAWQLIDSYRSLFDGILRDPIAWSHRLIDNKPLFWSVVVGFVTVFPTLYIPGLNHDAFLHTGIGKEWGIVFGMTLFFFISCEIWKWIKRRYVLQRRLVKQGEEIDQMDVESLDGRLDQGV